MAGPVVPIPAGGLNFITPRSTHLFNTYFVFNYSIAHVVTYDSLKIGTANDQVLSLSMPLRSLRPPLRTKQLISSFDERLLGTTVAESGSWPCSVDV